MSAFLYEWGNIAAMEDDIRNLDRLANVLTTLGMHSDGVSNDCIYVLGCMLDQMGKRLEARFDAIKPIQTGGRP